MRAVCVIAAVALVGAVWIAFGRRRNPFGFTRSGTANRVGRVAGATWLVLGTLGDDWRAQWELIAEAATLLD